ncbi:acylphosphatase [Patescibacteria group bacterium]
MPNIRIHIFASGRVHGVFFRDGIKKRAEKIGVFGWVKNLQDGRVEAVIEGEENKARKLEKWAKRGPFLADVKKLDSVEEDYTGEFIKFEIKYEI